MCESCHHKQHPRNRKVRTEQICILSQGKQERARDGAGGDAGTSKWRVWPKDKR
jgi:hypothetical protein